MSERWLDIFERTGDANLGQTILRLAGLAEAAHRHQAAMMMLGPARKAQDPATAGGTQPLATGADRAHKEVGP